MKIGVFTGDMVPEVSGTAPDNWRWWPNWLFIKHITHGQFCTQMPALIIGRHKTTKNWPNKTRQDGRDKIKGHHGKRGDLDKIVVAIKGQKRGGGDATTKMSTILGRQRSRQKYPKKSNLDVWTLREKFGFSGFTKPWPWARIPIDKSLIS